MSRTKVKRDYVAEGAYFILRYGIPLTTIVAVSHYLYTRYT